jgi:hypothetical protein
MLDPRHVQWTTRPSFEPGETDLVGTVGGVAESTMIDHDPRMVDPLPAAMERVCRAIEWRLTPPIPVAETF